MINPKFTRLKMAFTVAVFAPLFCIPLSAQQYYYEDVTLSHLPDLRVHSMDAEFVDVDGDGRLDFYLCARVNDKDGSWSQNIRLFGRPGKATRVQRRQPVGTDQMQVAKLAPASYHIQRGSLKNSLIKILLSGKRLRVAFVGGSITNMRKGWRSMLSAYLEQRFPETEFEFIQAGIPSMGSTSDAFRLLRDVLNNGPVDLLFVEAAVNDRGLGRTDREIVRAMEGIVRHARFYDPNTDVVFMYFADPWKTEDYHAGQVPRVISLHEKVAEHYQIPVINLAKEVTERIDAGEFDWEHDFRNLHPSQFGHQVYVRSMITFMENAWRGGLSDTDTLTGHPLPEKLDPGCYDRGELIPAWKIKPEKGWRYTERWVPELKAGTRRNYHHVPMLIGDYPAKTLTFKFEGDAVGIVDVAGPDAGVIEYRIDKGPWKRKDLFTRWSHRLYLPSYYTLGTGLKPGRHKLQIRLLEEKNSESKGRSCKIRYIYINR